MSSVAAAQGRSHANSSRNNGSNAVWESDIYPPEAWEDGPSTPPTPAASKAPAPATIRAAAPALRAPAPALRASAPPSKAPAPPSPTPAPAPLGSRHHPILVDTEGEVWEDDIYPPDAWVSGVEAVDWGQPTSAADESAAAASSGGGARDEGTHEEVFWPNVELYISSPAGSRPIVECIICANRLVIRDLQNPQDDTSQQYEEHTVLPCGHMIGTGCFREWEAIAASPVKCPVCKAVID